MLQDMIIHPTDKLPIEEISSPITAQIFDFCESELFQEAIQNTEIDSNSNCCYDENSNEIGQFMTPAQDNTGTPKTVSTTVNSSGATSIPANAAASTNDGNNKLPVIFDSPEEMENDISASIDFSVPSQFIINQQEPFDLSTLQCHQMDGPDGQGLPQYISGAGVPLVSPPLPPAYETECLSSIPSYLRLNPSSSSCSFLDPAAIAPYLNGPFSAENAGIFSNNLFLGTDLPSQDLEFQGENGGIFCPEPLPRAYNSGELQSIGNENQQAASNASGAGSVGNSTPSVASEISSLEDSSLKVGKLSDEQRKEKIHRYMKKRNERNFSKKIKYACRKTLADSRPRVRGRFAKNDDLGEPPRSISCSNHEEDTDEDVVVKEDYEDMVNSSDIFAHLSSVNSFECNYSIQSWI